MAKKPAHLTSDQLGEKGEAKFKDLCSDVGLIASKTGQDRAGWDFLVQTLCPAGETLNLDQRSALSTAYVQVKAVWRDRRPTVRLRLSAAEMLAKQRAASFIVVLAFDRDNIADFDLYVLEQTGDNLAKVLKTLRQTQAAGARAVNDATITFALKPAERLIHGDGASLKARLFAGLQAGEDRYIGEKIRQLKTLGYAERPMRVAATMHEVGARDVLEAFLGQREVRVTLSEAVETRFDISLPTGSPVVTGMMRITPKPCSTCRLTVRSSGLKRPLNFEGQFFHATVPAKTDILWRSRALFPGFEIGRMPGAITLNADPLGPEPTALTLAEWVKFHQLLHALVTTTTTFEMKIRAFEETVHWDYPAEPAQIPQSGACLLVAQTAKGLAAELDLPTPPVTLHQIYAIDRDLIRVAGFGLGSHRSIELGKIKPAEDTPAEPTPMLYVDMLDFFGHPVAYAATTTMTPSDTAEGRDWRTKDIRPVALEAIGETPADFAAFVERAKAIAGLDALLLGDMDESFLEEALGELSEF